MIEKTPRLSESASETSCSTDTQTELTVNSSHSTVDFLQVTVVIPALNEQESIGKVLSDLPDGPTVIVVDNGSSDATASIASAHGAIVVRESQRGYGSACLRGLSEIASRIASSTKPGCSVPRVVAFIDADYADHPELLPNLIEPILSGEFDFVLGSRILGKREPGAMPPQSIYGNRLACFLMRLFFRARYTDLGPFRAIDYQKLLDLQMTDTNFGWTVEMQIKAVKQKLRIKEIAVPYRQRVGTSKISGTVSGTIKAGYKILYLIFKYGIVGDQTKVSGSAGKKPD